MIYYEILWECLMRIIKVTYKMAYRIMRIILIMFSQIIKSYRESYNLFSFFFKTNRYSAIKSDNGINSRLDSMKRISKILR